MPHSLLTEIKAALNSLSIRPHSLRGQNFLVSREVLDKIIAAKPINPDLPVLEIGAGLASLTNMLADHASRLDLIEIEPLFAQRLVHLFADRPDIYVHHADALDFDYQDLYGDQPYLIYGNIPYNITTPLLKKLLIEGGNWQRMMLMVQKEAAIRICQGKGRENGPLTLLVEYFASSEICFEVSKEAFYPVPAVDSAIIALTRKEGVIADHAFLDLYRFIEAAFSLRRKTLANALCASGYGMDKQYWQAHLQELELRPDSRAESLSLPLLQQLFARHISQSSGQ